MSNKQRLEAVRKVMKACPDWGARKIGGGLGIKPSTVQGLMAAIRAESDLVNTVAPSKPEDLSDAALHLVRKGPITPASLSSALGIEPTQLPALLEHLAKKHNVNLQGAFLVQGTPTFGCIPIDLIDPPGNWVQIGLVADTHLACREERLDALHATYDLYADEKVKEVFHAGNLVDGYIQRINGASVKCTTPDDQAAYVIDNYPARDGVTTYFITGDDHEGWWIKDGLNWGAYLEMLAKQQGREDLRYIGHVEADIEFKRSGCGSTIMKVQHPGGGSAYARSYKPQKQIEAFQGGEKPQILVQGHYHVENYMVDRNIHVINLPGFQDQTVFGRKKQLRFEVGGALLRFKPNPDGSIARCVVEFKTFFDRGYYKAFLRSDKRILKGHLIVNN